MRKLLVLLFLPLFLSIFIAAANAEDSTTNSAQTTSSPAFRLREQAKLIEEQKNAAITKIKDEARAMIQAKREEFKVKLQTIKDQKKKALTERIDTKLANVNKIQMEKFSEALTRLQGFLDKASASAASPTIPNDITLAQVAINSAKSAVEVQAARSYTMNIVDEATLRISAGTIISQFRQDLSAVHKLVIDAKQAVKKLYPNKVEIKKEATGSAEL